MRTIPTKWLAAGLLVTMALLMIGAARQDSATVDEANQIGSGYLFWKRVPTRFGAGEHPPLGYVIEGFPLLFMDVKLSEMAQAMIRGELGSPWMLSWNGTIRPVRELLPPRCAGRYVPIPPLGDVLVQWLCPPPYPMNNWYYTAIPEEQMFGKVFLYGGANDGNALLLAGRLMQIGLALLSGLVIFFWVKRATSQDRAALVALATWVFLPVALAYGHVANTDIGATCGITLSIYLFGKLIEQPRLGTALLCGGAVGMALLMKLTALILGPIFLIATVLAWRQLQLSPRELCKTAAIVMLTAWLVVFVCFLPLSSPVPPSAGIDLALFDVPGWFKTLRPLLLPAGFFRSIALAFGHVQGGHDAYLMGEWSHLGWWYFFPLVILLKSPVAFVLLAAGGLAFFLRKVRSTRPLIWIPWLGAGLYLTIAMTSHASIGARHLLPVFALICVGIGCSVPWWTGQVLRVVLLGLLGWQALSVSLAYPLYIQFFSEAVGGAQNGYKYLFDSNFDWGQDAIRLKQYLDEHQIQHIYLDYFGNQFSTEYLKIPNTRVNAETAKQIRQGTLVISASEWVRPEWAWLRESRQSSARVAHTLFVYQFP